MKKNKIFIIAEAGINHNGSLATAKKLVDAAVQSGADAVKFQTFKAEEEISSFAPKADYQKQGAAENESLLEMTGNLELSDSDFKELRDYCRKKGINFLSTPSDIVSINLLNELGLKTFKIPSGEINDLPYLRKVGSLRKKIIMSTGIADLREVEAAISVLTEAGTPRKNITVLHCNTEYPTPAEDVNLSAMLTIKNALKVKVGYSDHTLGMETPVAAAALGASVIEKHFTLDRNMKGPDHRSSLEPAELKAMVKAIRNTEKILGSGIKRPSPSEIKNKTAVRKSIVARMNIKKGEAFTDKNLTTKRPATGINPMEWDNVIGRSAKKDFKKDEIIKL